MRSATSESFLWLRPIVAAGLVGFAFAFAACGGGNDSDGSAEGVPTATPAVSATTAAQPTPRGFEPGSYTAAIRGVPHRWEFRADGGFTMFRNDSAFQTGTFRATNDRIELTDDDGTPASCPPDTEPGIYRWTYDGKILTFERDRDTCQARSGDVSRSWTRRQ